MGRAFLYGLGAAVLGSVVFYAVSALTGYQFGLIAVVVGWAVGKAVRKGSGSFGGRRFQVLAVLLTYASIASTHVPGITKYFFEQSRARAAAASNVQPGSAVPQQSREKSAVAMAVFFGMVFLLALALPILTAARNILGLIIIGIALWEAWKFTREVKVAFSGPFTVSQSSSASSA
ncbi:MAG: hypothetical protein U0Q18_29830 [Bryobacteraceae bacterium]